MSEANWKQEGGTKPTKCFLHKVSIGLLWDVIIRMAILDFAAFGDRQIFGGLAGFIVSSLNLIKVVHGLLFANKHAYVHCSLYISRLEYS